MPALGADMENGTLVEWLVKPGDRVKRGDIVAVVETQKGAIEVEIFDEGIVSELAVPVGTLVPVGGLLARIGDGAAPPRAAAAPALPREAAALHPAARPAIATALAALTVPAARGAKVTPAARRRAMRVSLRTFGGSRSCTARSWKA